MEDTLVYRIAFASLRGINRVMAEQILSHIGDEQRFFEASERQLSSLMAIKSKLFDDDYRKSLIERGKREADFIFSSGVKPVYFTDEAYPKRLYDADDAPLMLFSLGNADLNHGRMISIVGTRHATPYGVDFVNRLIADLKSSLVEPVTVVSGLAFGIDAAAHTAALKLQMPTIGVLAHRPRGSQIAIIVLPMSL